MKDRLRRLRLDTGFEHEDEPEDDDGMEEVEDDRGGDELTDVIRMLEQ